MKNKVFDFIDFQKVNKLLEGFNKSTGFVTAILDLDGNVLSQSGWRSICTNFHRLHPDTLNNCKISDTILANQMGLGEKYHFYHCMNGLVDVAVPIVIKGEHIANLFSGQFFFEEPDRDRFGKQAEKYGFDHETYMKALYDVPVVTKEKVKVVLDFLLDMTQLISDITFQKMEQAVLNEALRISETRSRNILDNMLEGCQLIGFDWKYIYMNHTAEIHNRRLINELIGLRYMDVWPGIEQTEVFKCIESVLHSRESMHLENEFTFPNGDIGIFDLSIQPVPEGVFILSIDITERRQKEKQLFVSEFRFDKLYDNGPFGMVMVDQDFRFIKANPAICTLLGYSEMEMKHLTFKDISHPDELKKDLSQVIKLIAREIPVYKTTKRYIRKDGQIMWGSLTVTSTFDHEGYFLYNLAIIEDITTQKQVEKALQDSEIRFRKAFDTNPDAITITRLSDGVYVSANNGFNLIFGYEPNEVVGKTSLEINIWHDVEDRKRFVDALLSNGLVENFESNLLTKSGKRIDALVSSSIVEFDGIEHALSTTKDITKLKKIQKSLQASQEKVRKMNNQLEKRVEVRTAQLEAANKELEAFSYSVSHDLRAPLRHISGYVDLLNNRFKIDLPEKAQHYLYNISTSANQMGALIDDLLQFSRTGRQEVHQMTFQMNALFEDVFQKMKPDFKDRNITWQVPNMPEVRGDYAMLKQVWINLLDNAVKYTRKEENAQISVEWYETVDEFVFLVRDNGVGFDMKYADKLFGVFQRLHALTEFEGTGIGLANVKRIVQKHQGNVWAEAEPGKGACFYFSLPKK